MNYHNKKKLLNNNFLNVLNKKNYYITKLI